MKIQSLFVLIGIMIILVATTFGIIKSCKSKKIHSSDNTKQKSTNRVIPVVVPVERWSLCWLRMSTSPLKSEPFDTTGVCGDVEEIKFDKKGEILSMKAFFPSTKVTTHFWRKTGSEKGKWGQSSGTGWWTLKRIPGSSGFEGQLQGYDEEGKTRQLLLSKITTTEVITFTSPNTDQVSKMEKRLGPGWKKIEMIQGKWYGPYSIKNGTKWKTAAGSIIVRIDGNNNDTHLDFLGRKGIVDHGKKVDFSSTKKGTVMFFKY